MTEPWIVVMLALLPGAGNFAGGMAAEFWPVSSRGLNRALHAASGIVIAIVAVELMPEAAHALDGWWVALAFACGGLAYVALDVVIGRLQGSEAGAARRRMWVIYAAVATDLTSDGLMIGAGSAISVSLAIALAAGQVLADVPEGYAVTANLRDKRVPRKQRLIVSGSFFIYVVGAALASFFVLRDAPQAIKAGALVFVAGILVVAAVEDMLEEAHAARDDTRVSVLCFVGGFSLFILVSSGIESLLAN